MDYTKGAKGKLQIEDLLRHGGRSRQNYVCKLHEEAVRFHLKKDVVVIAEAKQESESSNLITAVQCLISLETVWSPLGAQGSEYARRCQQLHRLGLVQKPSICASSGCSVAVSLTQE